MGYSPYQLVQDFFHQQYFKECTLIYIPVTNHPNLLCILYDWQSCGRQASFTKFVATSNLTYRYVYPKQSMYGIYLPLFTCMFCRKQAIQVGNIPIPTIYQRYTNYTSLLYHMWCLGFYTYMVGWLYIPFPMGWLSCFRASPNVWPLMR